MGDGYIESCNGSTEGTGQYSTCGWCGIDFEYVRCTGCGNTYRMFKM